MIREELERITREWISIWQNPVDWDLFHCLHGDDFEDLSPGDRASNKEAFAYGIKELLRAFPDLKTNVEDMVVDEMGQQVAVRWSSVGINRERYLGTGPTNRKTVITGIEILKFSSGKIQKRWGEWDITDHTSNI